MPIQLPQWTEYLSCPVCENGFDLRSRPPISLGCGHSVCKTCLANLQRAVCPFDQGAINFPLNQLPVNTALVLLIDADADVDSLRPSSSGGLEEEEDAGSGAAKNFRRGMAHLEQLALYLKPSNRQQLSRPMQRKLVTLINCQLLEQDGRTRAGRAARSLGERSVTELILQHQNPQQLSANLWAAVRARGCQFLGPAMQEEVLKLVLLALEDGSALSRKVLVMFVVQRLEPHFPQASKTSIGHVVQLLYRASCFKVTKREGDSSLMQLKEEFRTYDTLRREHDAQIVQIATEAGLRIAPDQWSSLLYGDTTHKSHMQSIIDKLQTPQSFLQSVQELVIALQRTGDPGQLGAIRPHLDFLAAMDPSPDSPCPDWETLVGALGSVCTIVSGLVVFMEKHASVRRTSSGDSQGAPVGGGNGQGIGAGQAATSRYKTSLCRDLANRGSCPRGKNCTFAHSQMEIEQNRRRNRFAPKPAGLPGSAPGTGIAPMSQQKVLQPHQQPSQQQQQQQALFQDRESRHLQPFQHPAAPAPAPGAASAALPALTPVAQVAPLPRDGFVPPIGATVTIEPANLAPPPPPPQAHNVPPPVLPVYPSEQGGGVAVIPAGQDPSAMAPVPQMVLQHEATPSPVMPPGMVPQAIVQSLPVQPPAPSGGAAPPLEHESNMERYPLRDEVKIKKKDIPITMSTGMATKSLSALKSRKEEIIDYLEDLVGKEETAKITNHAVEVAPPIPARFLAKQNATAAEAANAILSQDQSFAMAAAAAVVSGSAPTEGFYSIWTSKSIATLPRTERKQEEGGENLAVAAAAATLGAPERENWVGGPGCEGKEMEVEDELIPFSDHPQISRFGPISRRAATMMQAITPSQTQAVISDEPTPTAVVRHSKQMAKQVPSFASLYLQNGSYTASANAAAALQPIAAVGPNGEIGYIAVPAAAAAAAAAATAGASTAPAAADQATFVPPTPPHHQTDITLQHIMQSSAAHQHQQTPSPSQSSMELYAESERMKQELEQLQRKISDLNMAHLDPARNRTAVATAAAAAAAASLGAANAMSLPPTVSLPLRQPLPAFAFPPGRPMQDLEKEELTKELVMIESTIKDRERELSISHRIQDATSGMIKKPQDMTQYSMSGTTSSGGNGGIMTTAVSGYRTSNTNTSAS